MVPAWLMTNDRGISILCRSDSWAVWKLTVYFCDRARQIRMSNVSWTIQRKSSLISVAAAAWHHKDMLISAKLDQHTLHKDTLISAAPYSILFYSRQLDQQTRIECRRIQTTLALIEGISRHTSKFGTQSVFAYHDGLFKIFLHCSFPQTGQVDIMKCWLIPAQIIKDS